MKTKSLTFLISLFIICLTILQLSHSQQYIQIELKIIFPNITVLQGSSVDSAFKAENLYEESLVVEYKFEKPTGMNITTRPEKWSKDIDPNESTTIHYTVSPGKNVANGSHIIKVWAEALETINDNHIQSEKYDINVTVLYNPTLHTTTTTSSTTTTSTTTTTLLEERIKETLLKKENLAILVVVILAFLMAIPYLTFKEEKTGTVETTGKEDKSSNSAEGEI